MQEEVSVIKIAGKFNLKNVLEKIYSEIVITETEEPLIGNIFSVFGSKKKEAEVEKKKKKNEIIVEIFKRAGRERLIFAKGTGNYARYVEIGGFLVYQHSKIEFQPWTPEEKTEWLIPSSSLLRKEFQVLAEEKFEQADQLINKRNRTSA